MTGKKSSVLSWLMVILLWQPTSQPLTGDHKLLRHTYVGWTGFGISSVLGHLNLDSFPGPSKGHLFSEQAAEIKVGRTKG